MGCGSTKTSDLSNDNKVHKNKKDIGKGKDEDDMIDKRHYKKKISKTGGGGKLVGQEYTEQELAILNKTDPNITETTPEEIRELLESNGFTMFHRVYDQDPFEVVNDYCKSNNKIFRSHNFVFEERNNECNIDIEWKRPREINPKCEVFLGDGPQLTDCKQGGIGNCGVCAMAGAVQTLPARQFNENLYPSYINPYGVYVVRVFIGGQWRYSLCDDLLPCAKGSNNLWSWHTEENLEMWPMLLEKHMANCSGEYNPWPKNFWKRSEEYPSPSMYDYGYIFNCNTRHNILQLSDNNNWKIFENYLGSDAVACQGWRTNKQTQDLGLVDRHGYIIIKAKAYPERNLYFLRIRNPWGCHEWKGDWSDKSPLWQKNQDLAQELNVTDKDDGAFWIERTDCIKHGMPELPLIFMASEKTGFANSVANGTLTPEMFDDVNLCPACHITIDEDCLIFFAPECIEYRYTEVDMRCYADIYFADGDQRSLNPVITTEGLDHDKGREPPNHFYELKKGQYIMVFRPTTKYEAERQFSSRISTRPGHTMQELKDFGSFAITTKCFDSIEELMVSPFSCYGSLDTTREIRGMFTGKGKVEFTKGYNLTFGDPNPGVLKYQCVSTVSNGTQIVGVYKEGTPFKMNKDNPEGTAQDEGWKSLKIDTLLLANFGGKNVKEEIAEKISGGKLNFVLESNMFESPLTDVKKALILCFYSRGQARQAYWYEGDEVVLDG